MNPPPSPVDRAVRALIVGLVAALVGLVLSVLVPFLVLLLP